VKIGRSAAGQLKVDVSFTQAGLPASIFPGISGYATGELGFHSTILDDPANDFFQLSPAADFRFILLAKDPDMEVWNDTGLDFMGIGEAFFIGPPPFDTHPIWNLVNATGGSQCVLHPGDTITGTITNHTITAYINGSPIVQGMDTNYASGNPGVGIFIQGAAGVNGDYGFTSFTAADGVVAPPPPRLTLLGPGANGAFTLQFNGVPGTACGIQYRENLNSPGWQPLGRGTADVLGLFQFTNLPPPGVSQRFYRSIWPQETGLKMPEAD
jgi:hypothetical protein